MLTGLWTIGIKVSDLRSKRKPNTNAVNDVQNGASGRADGPSSAVVNAEH
jgi:hypothetical protein